METGSRRGVSTGWLSRSAASNDILASHSASPNVRPLDNIVCVSPSRVTSTGTARRSSSTSGVSGSTASPASSVPLQKIRSPSSSVTPASVNSSIGVPAALIRVCGVSSAASQISTGRAPSANRGCPSGQKISASPSSSPADARTIHNLMFCFIALSIVPDFWPV